MNAGPDETTNAGESSSAEQAPADRKRASAEVDPRLLEILVCPATKKPLVYDREAMELISLAAGLAFPIRDGVPIMLTDEARPLEEAEIARLKARR